MVCNINLSEKENGVKIIQTAGYNGARTVVLRFTLEPFYQSEFPLLGWVFIPLNKKVICQILEKNLDCFSLWNSTIPLVY